MNSLEEYIETGFSVTQIKKMYANLVATNDIIFNLISGDYELTVEAVNNGMEWLSGFASYSKEGIH